MKNKNLSIYSNKDYRTGRNYYSVVDVDERYVTFEYYDQAVAYVDYYGYNPCDEIELSEDRLRREKAIRRNNKIYQILGE